MHQRLKNALRVTKQLCHFIPSPHSKNRSEIISSEISINIKVFFPTIYVLFRSSLPSSKCENISSSTLDQIQLVHISLFLRRLHNRYISQRSVQNPPQYVHHTASKKNTYHYLISRNLHHSQTFITSIAASHISTARQSPYVGIFPTATKKNLDFSIVDIRQVRILIRITRYRTSFSLNCELQHLRGRREEENITNEQGTIDT